MLIFSPQKLAFIAVPKTGSTAIEMALKPRADILFVKRRKHMPASRFRGKVAPFLEKDFGLVLESFAVMREPEEQIRSWYRYRARAARGGDQFSTNGISFDDFVLAVISDDPPPYAGIGSQAGMLMDKSGTLLVDHLFAHETPAPLNAFLEDRFGEQITRAERNVSPPVDAPLSEEVRAALRQARAAEFALYDRLKAGGGYLQGAAG